MSTPELISVRDITIEIGDIPICLRTESGEFARLLEDRYGEFVGPEQSLPAPVPTAMELEVELLGESAIRNDDVELGEQDDVSVRIEANRCVMPAVANVSQPPAGD